MLEIKEKQKNFISSIVYLNNNENEIKDFLKEIDNYMKENFVAYEFVIINNASKDKSLDIIREISKEISGKITIVNLAYRHSKEEAMVAGEDLAIGDYVIEFESPVIDFEISELDRCYKELLKGYDIISAVPKNKVCFFNNVFYKLFQKFAIKNVKLQKESFRILSRRAINRIYKDKKAFVYRKIIYNSIGLKAVDYYYNPTTKIYLENKSFKEKVNLAINILFRYSRIEFLYGILCLISIIIGIISSIVYKSFVMLIVACFVVIIFALGFIIKQMQEVYLEISKKSLYTFESIERL